MMSKEMYPIIIGIAGKARAGKDTVAQALGEVIPLHYRVNSYAFADGLRGALLALDPIVGCDAFGFDRLSAVLEDYKGWEGVKDSMYGPEIRRLLQRLGTESIRSLDNDFWVRQTMRRVRDIEERHDNMIHIIHDVRFENEANAIRNSMRGVVVRVDNPDLRIAEDNHPSEVIDFDTDYVFTNKPSEGIVAFRKNVSALWHTIHKEVIL